jgi:hypothetical protein
VLGAWAGPAITDSVSPRLTATRGSMTLVANDAHAFPADFLGVPVAQPVVA